MTPREKRAVNLMQAAESAAGELRSVIIHTRRALALADDTAAHRTLVDAVDLATEALASLRSEILRCASRIQELADTEPPESPWRKSDSILEAEFGKKK